MKNLIDAKTEDEIYAKKAFITNLQRVIDQEAKEVKEMVLKDVLKNADVPEDVEEEHIADWVFCYVHNCDELLSLEEYVDSFNATLVIER